MWLGGLLHFMTNDRTPLAATVIRFSIVEL